MARQLLLRELAEQIMALSVAFVPEPAPRRQATRARKRVVLSDECWQLLRWQLWFYGRHSGAATDAGSVLRRVPRLKLKPQDAFMDTRAARAAERLGTSAGSRREASPNDPNWHIRPRLRDTRRRCCARSRSTMRKNLRRTTLACPFTPASGPLGLVAW